MVPTLDPGDRVVVVRRRPAPGEVAAVRDPRLPSRVMVKRVVEVREDGSVLVAGDNPALSTDSRHFGPVPRRLVLGRVAYRYAPASRAGRVV